jgi:hypothetical protein
MTKLKSEGRCVYCSQFYDKRSIGKHLDKHLAEAAKTEANSSARAFHIRVEAAEMFLELLIDANAQLEDLDVFLGQIWLQCCGHLSAFQHKGRYEEDGIDMSAEVGAVFRTDMVLDYEYDFGSTTQLTIKVGASFAVSVPDGILLLSRNEPLQILCTTCKTQSATQICSIHIYEGNGFFCDKCAKKHAKKCEDFADYAAMPVVNSPRMGVCAYDGGSIDTERDGVYLERVS